MSAILIAVFWSGTTNSVFTVEFDNFAACDAAGVSYTRMVALESQAWVSSFGKAGNFAIVPTPAKASYVCMPKG